VSLQGIIKRKLIPHRSNSTSNPRNFSYAHNASKFKTTQWAQAGYSYRKMADKTQFQINQFGNERGLISDSYMDWYGTRIGNITHGPKGYNVLYADSSVVWVADPTQWAATTSTGNVTMHADDLAVWTQLLDR
jgi:hypothetical protein